MIKILIGLFVVIIIAIIVVSFFYFRKDITHNVIQYSTLDLVGDFSQKYPSTLLPVSKVGNKYTLAFSLYSNDVAENSS